MELIFPKATVLPKTFHSDNQTERNAATMRFSLFFCRSLSKYTFKKAVSLDFFIFLCYNKEKVLHQHNQGVPL
ncbi:MAG: hypothetical protein IJW46_05720 [Clostridia bacterium]|nr:hypothetical protein [Clostridia bacterium]